MADSSTQGSLTVLGGPLSGTRFVLEEVVDNILIGSDPSCRFCLPVPGVSPIHARLWIDVTGATVYDTNSPRGLYVNDDRVNGQLPLKNGDVLWLGTPGEEEVVMIQCRLSSGSSQSSAASADRAAVVTFGEGDEGATMAIDPRALGSWGEPPPLLADDTPTKIEGVDRRAPIVEREAPSLAAAVEPESPQLVAEVDAEGPPLAAEPWKAKDSGEEPVRFTTSVEIPESPRPPAHFEEDIEEPPPVFSPPPTVISPPPAAAPEPAAVAPVLPSPRPAPSPARPASAPWTAPTPVPGHRPVPARAARSVPERTPVPPSAASAAPSPSGRASGTRYAVLGLVALLLIGAGAVVVLRMRSPAPVEVATASPPPPTVAASLPPPSAAPPVSLVASQPPPSVAPPPPTPPPEAPVLEEVTIVKSPPPAVAASPGQPGLPTPAAVPSGKPKASPPPTKPPAAATPSADVLRAQQVAGLISQADQALAANRHETASGLYDEALKLDAHNAAATAGKARAQAGLGLARRSFVAGRTIVQTEKAGKSLSGFDNEDVSLQKAPDFLGRIEFDVSPERVAPGVSYTVKVFVVNEGRKPIKIRSLSLGTIANGSRSETPISGNKEIAPQQRLQVAQVGGEWKDGTSAWSLEAQVTADKGDRLKNQLTWK